MLFRRSFSVQSNKDADTLRKHFLGQHLIVHNLDFEISEKNGTIKVIPHAENSDQVYTLPITRLKFENRPGGCTVRGLSKPRRIDIGGPYLILIFVTFALIAAAVLYIKADPEYIRTVYILTGGALLVFAILWFRMEQGYFDYIRKIKKWLKEHS
jgi:hypothetical protein